MYISIMAMKAIHIRWIRTGSQTAGLKNHKQTIFHEYCNKNFFLLDRASGPSGLAKLGLILNFLF